MIKKCLFPAAGYGTRFLPATKAVPKEMLQYVPLLGSLILGMGTKRNPYTEISKRIGIHTGGIRSSHFSSATVQDRQSILSYIFFNGKALIEKNDDLFDRSWKVSAAPKVVLRSFSPPILGLRGDTSLRGVERPRPP